MLEGVVPLNRGNDKGVVVINGGKFPKLNTYYAATKLIQQTNARSRVNAKNAPQERGEKTASASGRPTRGGSERGKKQQLQIRHQQYIRLPAHKVPRRSEQVSHEKDMFRVKYGAEISPTFRREH